MQTNSIICKVRMHSSNYALKCDWEKSMKKNVPKMHVNVT